MSRKVKFTVISSMVSMLLALALLVTVTMAWLSMNKKVDSAGMQMSMDVGANLVIGKTAGDVNPSEVTEANFTITYNSGRTEMLPSTADWTVGTATGLKYVTNTWDVGFGTGIQKSGKTLSYAAVPSAADSKYYVDFDAYIASAGKAMDNVKLVAILSTATIASTDPHLNAATIAIYQNSVASGNLKGAINVANQSTGEINITLSGNSVPVNTGTPLHFIIRCYFDGALVQSGSTNTYIKSSTINTNQVALNVSFTAVDLS